MNWDQYAEKFKNKGRWGQWREWNRLSPVERDYLKTMYALTPPPPPQGLWARIGSWPPSNILGLWLAESVIFLFSLVLTAHTSAGVSHFDIPAALTWWLVFLTPGLLVTWLWVKVQEMKKK